MTKESFAIRADDFPGVEVLVGKKVTSGLDAVDLMLNALLERAAQLQDPLKKQFLETICHAALRCTVLEPKIKAYLCAVGGLKDEGELQDFMRYTIASLKSEGVFPEGSGRQ